MNHSPLPWKIIYGEDDYAEEVFGIESSINSERRIVETDCGCYPPESRDAEFIIRAVNSHYALCDLLKQCVQGLKAYEHKGDYPLDVLILQCEELIEKLKKEDK